jgi:hypothetical protein
MIDEQIVDSRQKQRPEGRIVKVGVNVVNGSFSDTSPNDLSEFGLFLLDSTQPGHVRHASGKDGSIAIRIFSPRSHQQFVE